MVEEGIYSTTSALQNGKDSAVTTPAVALYLTIALGVVMLAMWLYTWPSLVASGVTADDWGYAQGESVPAPSSTESQRHRFLLDQIPLSDESGPEDRIRLLLAITTMRTTYQQMFATHTCLRWQKKATDALRAHEDASIWDNDHYRITQVLWDLGGGGWQHHAAMRITFNEGEPSEKTVYFDNGSEPGGDRHMFFSWERGSLILDDPGHPVIREGTIESPIDSSEWGIF